jgi:uncharacterized protein (TIGR01244 family)
MTRPLRRRLAVALLACGFAAGSLSAASPRGVKAVGESARQSAPPPATSPETLDGALNYTRVDAVVACGGATSPEALAELKRRGFRSVLNLRQASEAGANVEEEGRVVRQLGMTYLHIPFDGSRPTAQPIERFLAAFDHSDHLPIYIHCGTANRVGAMWLVKRVLRDGWTTEKALAEAEGIGLSNAALRTFMLDYVAQKKKGV